MLRNKKIKNKNRVSYDQNLTIDCSIEFKNNICQFYKNKEIIEIGPGRGFFTRILKEVCSKLLLIEIDSVFSRDLKNENYDIINADFKLWLTTLSKEDLKKENYLFSSLPYSQLKALFTSQLNFSGFFIVPNYILEKRGIFVSYLRYCYDLKVLSEVPLSYFDPIPSLSSSYVFINRKRFENYDYFKKVFPKPLKLIKGSTKRLHELTEYEIENILIRYSK